MLPDHLTRLHDETEPENTHSRPWRPTSQLGLCLEPLLMAGCPPRHRPVPWRTIIPFSKPPKRDREGAIRRGLPAQGTEAKRAWEISWVTRIGGLEGFCCSSIRKPHAANFYHDSCKQIASVAMCSAGIILAGRRAGRGTHHYPFSYLSVHLPFHPLLTCSQCPAFLPKPPPVPLAHMQTRLVLWAEPAPAHPPTHPSHSLLSSCLSAEGRFTGEGSALHL